MKQCMYIEVMPHICGDSRCGNVDWHWWFVLRLLYKPYWCCCWCPLSEARFNLNKETESSLRIVVFYIKDRTMDNVQNCDSYINIPSSQTYR
jgi:hypothetical protein